MRVDANEARDWRNCAEIAQRVLVNAREIHAGDVLNCPQQRAIAKRSNWAAKSSTSSGTSPSTGHGALHQRLEPAMHEQDAVSSQIETNLTRVFFVILAMLALLLPVSMLIQFLVAEAPAVLPAFFDQNLVSKTPLLERIEKLIPLSLILSATLIAPFLARRAQAAPATAMAFTIGAFIVLFHEAERQLAKGRWWATLMLFASICGLLLYHWRTARGATVAPANVAATGDRHWAGFNWADGVVIAFMYLILLPASFEVSAKTLNFDYHSVSYMIGPAINLRFANGLLPGVDFHAHYGLGHPFLFSYLIQPSATGTLIAFTKYLSAFNVVFYATGYLICRLFIGAQFWVALAFFVAILLNFQSDYAFIFPSNWSPRYPLLFMVAALFAVTVSSTDRKSGILAAVGLGAALGLSLFLSTETGLYFGAATALIFHRLAGPRLLSRQAEPFQQSPHRYRMHRLAEPHLRDRHQIVAREIAIAVLLRIGSGHHDGEQIVQRQHRRTPSLPVIGKSGDAVLVVADDPVPERLAVHPGATSGLRSTHGGERVGDGQQSPRGAVGGGAECQ